MAGGEDEHPELDLVAVSRRTDALLDRNLENVSLDRGSGDVLGFDLVLNGLVERFGLRKGAIRISVADRRFPVRVHELGHDGRDCREAVDAVQALHHGRSVIDLCQTEDGVDHVQVQIQRVLADKAEIAEVGVGDCVLARLRGHVGPLLAGLDLV